MNEAAPDVTRLLAAVEATWPPEARADLGAVTLRDGAGGGKRVSAATVLPGWREADIAAAEAQMETPLFMVRDGETDLDMLLETRGYRVIDPVWLRLAPVSALTDTPVPLVTAFTIWEPLAIMREIWAEGGIGPARIDVMTRAQGPKTGLFGRTGDKPAGTGFVALDGDIAMIHALEVREAHRGRGMAGWMMRAAAHWAARNGAQWLTCVVTQQNAAANALYDRLGLMPVTGYHYRIREVT